MALSSSASFSQRDARASALLEQSTRQKLELAQLVKSAFASSPSSSKSRSSHTRDTNAKLLNPDLDFARKSLRNTYINLLFTCTFTREAQSIDGLLWTETCYNIITSYRSYLATTIKAGDQADGQGSGRRNKISHEANRAKNEFRRFLVDEEIFWQELAGRLVRLFSLEETRSNLESLGIACDSDGDTTVASTAESDLSPSRVIRQSNEPDEALSQAALLPTKRSHLIVFLHSFLIFCGDLARYREIASREDDNDAPAAARSSRAAAGRKYDFSRAVAFYEQSRLILPDKGNSSNQLAVVSNYNHDTFASLYHYCRALCCKTPFSKAKINVEKLLAKPTAAYLERRSSAQQPCWNESIDREARDPAIIEHLSNNKAAADKLVAAWTEQVVVLHGLFFKRAHLDHIQYLSKSVLATFSTLVRARALRADQIVRFLVTALCASWTTRLWRTASGSSSAQSRVSTEADSRRRPQAVRSEKSRKAAPSAETVQCVEYLVLAHVLGGFHELIEIDASETLNAINLRKNGISDSDADRDRVGRDGSPVRHLTPVVRRTLPAMRIMNKWIKTHLEYMQRIERRASDFVQRRSAFEANPQAQHDDDHYSTYTATLSSIEKCWTAYVEMINNFRFAFPFDSLPNIGKVGPVGASALCLEEDTDMRGFAPTRKATQSTIPGGTTITFGMGETCANAESVRPSQLHPNEEQLMRIADLLIDAKVIAESDASPLQFNDQQNSFRYVAQAARSKVRSSTAVEPQDNYEHRGTVQPGLQQAKLERALASDASPKDDTDGESVTTDDPVDLAMRAIDSRQDESELESVEAMQSISMSDNPSNSSQGRDHDHLLVPSQVRSKRNQGHDDLTRQLFAAYPLPPQEGSGSASTAVRATEPAYSTPQLNLQGGQTAMTGQQNTNKMAFSAAPHAPNMMMTNASTISSIWAPSNADTGVSGSSAHVGMNSAAGFGSPHGHYRPQHPHSFGFGGVQPNVWGNQGGPYGFVQPQQQAPSSHAFGGTASSHYAPYISNAQAAYPQSLYGTLQNHGVDTSQPPSSLDRINMPPAGPGTVARNSPFSDPYYPGHPASPYYQQRH